MKISIAIIFLLSIILCSCTGSRYSSETILKEVDFDNIDSIKIQSYRSVLRRESDTALKELIIDKIIDQPITIELNKDSLKNRIKHFLNSFPESRGIPYDKSELIAFKKDYLRKKNIDTLDIDSLYNIPRKKWATRNIISYEYSITFYFQKEDEESLFMWKLGDNVINYSFCCTDNENDILYRTFKGYTAYSTEYILDIEFQKRYIELFNSVLSYYNKTNRTDYPLLDVDYEIWSGIIRDY